MLGVSLALALAAFYLLGSTGYEYSLDQQQALQRHGSPDAFLIQFAREEDGEYARAEEWYYHRYGFLITFLDGEALLTEPMGAPQSVAAPAPYQPRQFSPFMGWQDVYYATGERPAGRGSDYYAELFAGTDVELYYSDQLVVGVEASGERLIYVAASALVAADAPIAGSGGQ